MAAAPVIRLALTAKKAGWSNAAAASASSLAASAIQPALGRRRYRTAIRPPLQSRTAGERSDARRSLSRPLPACPCLIAHHGVVAEHSTTTALSGSVSTSSAAQTSSGVNRCPFIDGRRNRCASRVGESASERVVEMGHHRWSDKEAQQTCALSVHLGKAATSIVLWTRRLGDPSAAKQAGALVNGGQPANAVSKVSKSDEVR